MSYKGFLISPQEFKKRFLQHYADSVKDFSKKGDKKAWTTFMIGNGASREKGDFGILGRCAQGEYRVSAEELRVDQTWWRFKTGIENRDYSDEWQYFVAIENENEPDRIIFTLSKLRHLNIPLKVVVSYPKKKDIPSLERKINEIIASDCTDADRNTYLFAFGPYDWNIQGVGQWQFYTHNLIERNPT